VTVGTLLWCSLARNWPRTLFVLAAVLAAFTLFGTLETIRYERDTPPEDADVISVQSDSGTVGLPRVYESRIAGLKDVLAVTGLIGTPVQSPRKASESLPVFGMNAASVAKTFLGLGLTEETATKWRNTRNGAICDDRTAREMGWHVNDHLSPRLTLGSTASGSDHLDMILLATYPNKLPLGGLITSSEYLLTELPGNNQFGQLFVRAREGRSPRDVARQIDSIFRNGPVETQSAPIFEYRQHAARNAATVRQIIRGTLGIAFFTLVFVVANALAQSVRERMGEVAILRAVGFQQWAVLLLAAAEALVLFTSGAALGLVLATVGFASDLVSAPAGSWVLPAHTVALASLYAVGCALIAAVSPCWELSRLRVAEALRSL
jgi:putative ABC transport system permease protein